MRPPFQRTFAILTSAGVLLLATATNHAQTASTVTTARTFTDTRLAMTVVATEIELPLGRWQVNTLPPTAPIDQVFLMPRLDAQDMPGRRAQIAERQQMAQFAMYQVQSLYEPVMQYAATHGGVGPATIKELDRQRFGPYLDELPGKVFLVPSARVVARAGGRATGPAAAATPLAFELQPYVDDGRHWVLFTDGRVERVAIDRALVAKYKVTVAPFDNTQVKPASAPGLVRHALYALVRDASAASATLTLTDELSAARRDLQWTLKGGQSDPQLLGEWASARAMHWMPLARTQAPVLQIWLDRSRELYGQTTGARGLGAMMDAGAMSQAGAMRPQRSASAFDILGGRAAIRETLQTDVLRSTSRGSTLTTVPVTKLTGVDVPALPFTKMLAGRTGGRLALADLVPEDRLLVYFAKPSAVFPFLTQGANMIGRAGSTMTSTAFDDNLKARYLRRLGLPEDASRKILESGAITELAIAAPDLFFIDGTDLTVLMRLKAPDVAVATLGVLAGVNVPATGVAEKLTTTGRTAYWARQGDVLIVSTNRGEIDAVRRVAAGTGSLGRTAELQYMLTELPMRGETRAFVYLSDPFIRRMVGPAVKIGQLRRVQAAADMTMITAGALLYKLDGHRDLPTVTRLQSLGYVRQNVDPSAYRIEPDFSVVSAKWGTLAELQSLQSSPVTLVTQAEAEAYETYVAEYKTYWRQFFDPIGMRLDDAPDGALELSTFILPLIDSQLYDTVRGVLNTAEQKTPLRVPNVTPSPVFQLSLNLTDASWVSVSQGWSDMFSQYTGIGREIFDLLGPGLHIAVQDADPVISLGTADLLGAFGASTFGPRFDIAIPFAMSILTRPCKIYLELQDPAKALTILRQAAGNFSSDRLGMNVAFRQVEGKDAWVYTLGMPGIATFRLGLEVQDRFLVFSNVPWSGAAAIDRVDTRALNGGAIKIAPDAVKQGLAALFATQAEQDHGAALGSMAALLPLLQTVASTPDEAAAKHAALFGTMPVHPGTTGRFVWTNGAIESTQFGSPTRWKAPAFTPDLAKFGLFDGTSLVDLSMQLEQGGLRATARWHWKEK